MAKRASQPALRRTGAVPGWMLRLAAYRALIVPVAFIALLVVILVPLPPVILDLLICLNISLSVVILLTTIYMVEPLEFSVFPSLLLGTTLFRLVLNIASTRLILTADADNAEDALNVAGHVISAFGGFVAGGGAGAGGLAVGIIIFLILVIVQFQVITKGATRISEVAARFTLDALPGKQMAIDADLNAGLIDEQEARRRRERISNEADFFGAMDGASKFVRGDAVAGLIITAINILGGFAIGVLDRGWPAAQTASVFTKLTIGDGLTSQIPSFVIAIASALIVTRSGSKAQLGNELTSQVVSQPTGLLLTAGFLVLLSVTPLPTFPLLISAAALGGIAWGLRRSAGAAKQKEQDTKRAAQGAGGGAGAGGEPPAPETLLKLDALELEVGYGLVSLVDAGQGGDLLDRIGAIRRQLAAEMGFIMPPVRIRDNMQIPPHEYRIKIRANTVASGQTRPGRLLAMDSGIASGAIEGEPTREPAFGLDAWWIEPSLKGRAETMNYTVVDPTSVLATHLTEIVRRHADELLTREEVTTLLDQLKEKSPKLVGDLVPDPVKPGDLQKILQNLLRERVPIRDLESILETLADWCPRTKDLDVLTEYVRNALRRTICRQYAVAEEAGGGAAASASSGGEAGRLVCITLDPALEDQISGFVDRSAGSTVLNMPAPVANRIAREVMKGLERLTAAGHQPIILASPPVRAVIRQIMEPHVPGVVVLGFNEVVQGVEVESLALVSMAQPAQAMSAA